jgi:hypothetical protein
MDPIALAAGIILLLLFDCRDRGESERARRTLGFIEQLDAAAAISHAKSRYGKGNGLFPGSSRPVAPQRRRGSLPVKMYGF